MIARLLAIAFGGVLVGCNQAGPAGSPALKPPESPSARSPIVLASPLGSERASLVSILSDPQRWEGKAVTTTGFMHLEFEGSRLCLHREDVQFTVITNCVRLSIGDEPRLKVVNDRYVFLEGVVRSESRLYTARIEGVSSVAPTPTQAELAEWGRSR